MKRVIKELPPEERPREKLLRLGAEALTNSELLAILIRTGTKDKNALELSRELLKKFGGLKGLTKASMQELTAVKGLGKAKAVSLVAALELCRRSKAHPPTKIASPEEAFKLLAPLFGDKEVEHFGVVTLNGKGAVISIHTVAVGAGNMAAVSPKEVFRPAVRDLAQGVILFHNHPSQDPTPSVEDLKITEKLIEAGRLLGIEVLDHLIVTKADYFSFKGEGIV